MIDHLFGTIEAERREASALGHQWLGKPGQLDEGIAGDQHRFGKTIGRAIGEAAVQILLARPGDGMEGKVKPAPTRANRTEYCFQLARHRYIAGQYDRGADAFGTGSDEELR